MNDRISEDALFRHIWQTYQATVDGRQKYGDVTLLAEAADRMNWPGAPQIGTAIASILRDFVAKEKTGKASKHYRNVRDREIAALARIHLQAGMTSAESQKRLAEFYDNITPDAVRKIVERASEDKHADK